MNIHEDWSFLGDQTPEVGGGYTFESEILQCIGNIKLKNGHTFVLLSSAKVKPQASLMIDTQFVSLHYDWRELHSWRERLTYKFRDIIVGSWENLHHRKSESKFEKDYSKFLRDRLLNSGIEIIWSLIPSNLPEPIMELPYISVVWDLQHRLQPYFPEVSTEGQWYEREQMYTTTLQRAAVVLSGTEVGKAEIEHFYQVPPERIRVIPLPTPSFALEALPNNDKQVLTKYNIPENYLFYPAQFWPHKNHIGLLQAVQILRDKYDTIFPVVFAGSNKGNLGYVQQVVANLDLLSQTYFLGFVSQHDLISLYKNAFALTFLSFFGPDNLPPLEAFALGCPVIASNVSGVKEQLGEAALLVNPSDPEQIALAIKSLHDDCTLYQQLIQRGLGRASKWTVQDYVKGVLSVVDELEPFRRCWSSQAIYRQAVE